MHKHLPKLRASLSIALRTRALLPLTNRRTYGSGSSGLRVSIRWPQVQVPAPARHRRGTVIVSPPFIAEEAGTQAEIARVAAEVAKLKEELGLV